MPPSPIDINALRQAVMAQAMQRQAPTAYPTDPTQMRVMPGAPLPSGAPNTPGMPVPPMPNPGAPSPINVGNAGPASPAQAMAKVGQGAQSPLLDPQTRDLAKALVQKLITHM